MDDQPTAPPPPVPATRDLDVAAGPPKTCPSSACSEGALLLGVMTSSGKLAYLHPPVPVDAGFAGREAARGTPERRYRFAGPCLEGGCPQWTGRGCAIAEMAADPVNLGLPASPRALPACGIRHSCRWYFQRGPAACAVCPLIVADMGGTDTYQSVQAEAYDHDRDTRQLLPLADSELISPSDARLFGPAESDEAVTGRVFLRPRMHPGAAVALPGAAGESEVQERASGLRHGEQ